MRIKNYETVICCADAAVSDRVKEVSNDNYSDLKIFKIELTRYYDIVDVLIRTLTPLEVERAHRYHQLKDFKRFVICRSILKIIIAQLKGLKVSQVYFEKNDNHKPYFPLDKLLFFNVSHAGDYALIAIGPCELGVDIECINPQFEYDEILTTVFSTEEINFINDSEDERYDFYKLWTRKEAIVKATGQGIDDNVFKIPVKDGSHIVSASLVNNFNKINVYSFNITTNYIGSIAYKGDDVDLKQIVFQPIPSAKKLESLV
ncbi:4'-phosphopantetheinyl transferase family protein [Winogradskyella psychrotolerans]|uniref:4'-phosphopantetheinyl transferase family protein n=1 Tax=Winogradskyella psychrotolerans TaxID=1344585 RepID=UPI001C06B061|nr:4'-phosphopantetheinyl transferase superfamily protein [Winogradskyella psychrotolerans]MBU2928312.1 4'-phosphopantetheinyl transferase superfamily protein [Winogradskyella psychrotolerans]